MKPEAGTCWGVHGFVSFQPVTRVPSGLEKLGIKLLEHDRKGKKVEKWPSCHQVGQVTGGRRVLPATFWTEKREGRRELERPSDCPCDQGTSQQLFCSSKGGGSCLTCHRRRWLDIQSCLGKKKEKTGKKKRKMQVWVTGQMGTLRMMKQGSQRALAFPSWIVDCEGKEEVSKVQTKWCWEWVGKVKWWKHWEEILKMQMLLSVLPPRTWAA